jgi:hypothetical protein
MITLKLSNVEAAVLMNQMRANQLLAIRKQATMPEKYDELLTLHDFFKLVGDKLEKEGVKI